MFDDVVIFVAEEAFGVEAALRVEPEPPPGYRYRLRADDIRSVGVCPGRERAHLDGFRDLLGALGRRGVEFPIVTVRLRERRFRLRLLAHPRGGYRCLVVELGERRLTRPPTRETARFSDSRAALIAGYWLALAEAGMLEA